MIASRIYRDRLPCPGCGRRPSRAGALVGEMHHDCDANIARAPVQVRPRSTASLRNRWGNGNPVNTSRILRRTPLSEIENRCMRKPRRFRVGYSFRLKLSSIATAMSSPRAAPILSYEATKADRRVFECYTEKARRVIFFGRYEASQFGSPYIETEHLLLGLLREDKALTHRCLAL
jgi:hypothetical protein